jgi:hypothetical protein
MTAKAPASARRRAPIAVCAAFGIVLAAVLVAANLIVANLRVAGLPLPDYATWSGVMEIEQKLRLLESFAAKGDVDALIVSSSLGDYGISADTLTNELTALHGRPFRVFNFGIGGGDIVTYARLYRLARLSAKPKQVWLVAPVSGGLGPDLEDKLREGPIGRYGQVPGLLSLSHAVHELPLVRYAPAMRDAAIHRAFPHRPPGQLDYYALNANGDTCSWIHNSTEYAKAPSEAAARHRRVQGFTHLPAEKYKAVYLTEPVLSALHELRTELQRDGVRLVIIPIDYAVAMAGRNAALAAAERRYFDLLSSELDAPVVNAIDDFHADAYMVQDVLHLNQLGAREFSIALAARIAGRESARASPKFAPAVPELPGNVFTALIPRRAADPAGSLRLTYIQNWGLPRLRPYTDARLLVARPGKRDVAVSTRVLADGTVIADTSAIAFDAVDQVVGVSLLAGYRDAREQMRISVANFQWEAQSHPSGFYERQERATVASEAPVYRPDEPLSVTWRDIEEPSRLDWIGVFPAGGDLKQRVEFGFLGGASSGRMRLPALSVPGRYELRLFRNDRWDVVTISAPFEVR